MSGPPALFAPAPPGPAELCSVLRAVAERGGQRVLLLPALGGVERALARAGRGSIDSGLVPWLVRLHRQALAACAPGCAELPVAGSWLATLALALPGAERGVQEAEAQVAAAGPRLAVAVAVAALRSAGAQAFGGDAAGLLRVGPRGVDLATSRRQLRWTLRALPGDAVLVVPAGFGATRDGRLVRVADSARHLAAALGAAPAVLARPARVA